MNLFRMEIRKNAVSMLTWSFVITLMISVTMAVYPVFMANQSKIAAMLTIIPKGVLQFKGISDFNDLLSPLGYYAANNVIYVMVLGSIYSVVLSSNIVLKEEYDKTAEFLLSWPVTRSEVLMSKIAVTVSYILLLNIITSLAGYLWLQFVKTAPLSASSFLALSAYTFLLNLFFCAAGLFISVNVKRARPITTFCIALVLIFYFIDTLSKITADISWLGYFSPFRYARVDAVSPGYGLDLINLLFFAGFIFLFGILAWMKYRKKDIYL